MHTSLVTTPFLAALGALTALAGLGTVAARRRPILRRLGTAATAALLLATAAAGVNTYFDYIPTVGALVGRRAADQASVHQVLHAIQTPALPPHGLVEKVAIPAPASGFRARPAAVYLPPAWFARPRPALPVIELLHGTPGTPDDWTRAGEADLAADRWAATHQGRAPILVMPDVNGSFTADTECVDGPRGRAETYLTVDVPRFVVSAFGATDDPRGWAIAGASEGGYCALTLALRHPDRYGAFGDFAGLDRPTAHGGIRRLFPPGDRNGPLGHMPRWLLRHRPRAAGPAGWFEVGGADGATTRAVLRTARAAARAGLTTEVRVLPHAHHTWRVFRHALWDAFPWLATRLEAGVSATERVRAA